MTTEVLERAVVSDDLKLLVEWSSPWEEFVTSIRPALAKSQRPLAGEARTGPAHHREMAIGWVVEAVLIALAIILPAKLAVFHPAQLPVMPKWDVIYFSGDELPQTEDKGGARAGHSGRSGGHEAHHRSQVIRVARGELVQEKIVDAPKLNLPLSSSAVANLLAYKPVPGPAPAEGLKSSSHAPALPYTPVAPAPDAATARMRTAPSMNATVVPPSPNLKQDRLRTGPMMNASVVPPTPDANREKMRTAPTMIASIVPPSPSAPVEITPVRVPGNQMVTVVPPPVSAPEQISNLNPKLTLPSPSVVPPPPTQITKDIRPGPGFGTGDLQKQVVPPPVQMSGASSDRRGYGGLGSANVVPPPVVVNGAQGGRALVAGLGNPSVVAPPVSGSELNSKAGSRSQTATLGTPKVVPPPVQVGGGGLSNRTTASLGNAPIVPPPPNAANVGSTSGLGRSNRGKGLGGPLDAGSVASPPSNTGGSAPGSGVVVSNQPGTVIGLPGGAGGGSLAMSPSGGKQPGIGSGTGGSGISRGEGAAAGLMKGATGAASSGSGPGADPATAGISPYPGTGGAGTGAVSKPPIPGVSVHGGSDVITLPSFGGGDSAASVPGRSSKIKSREGPDITIVGTSRSGGAFNFYGTLKGDRVYTIYIDTALGTAVMEYADPASADHPYAGDLTAPQALRADVPPNLKKSRLVISCVLDRSGQLRNPKVLEHTSNELTAKVLTALANWKFSPVLRGQQPIDVDAILGFDIDTR